MSEVYTQTINTLIAEFSALPGIGPKTAERLAFHILKIDSCDALRLAEAIRNVKKKLRRCRICFNLAEAEKCTICSDSRRNSSIVCVVEQPKDIINLEKTGACKWLYHVLGGHIAPLEGIEPDDLTIKQLTERVRKGRIDEVVMATNPNVSGDGTALYISSLLKPFNVKITRLARGLPAGSTIEYAGSNILTDAITGRTAME